MRENVIRTMTLSYLIIMTSCHIEDLGKEKFGTLSPHVALNLGYSEYTVLELLEDLDTESLEVNDADQTIKILLKSNATFGDNESLIAIGTVSKLVEFAPAVDIPSAPIGFELPIDETFTFSFPANNGEEIDSVVFGGGTLDFEMESSFKGTINYTWEIEGTKVVETDQNLKQTKELVYTGGQVTDSYSRSLDGLKSRFYKNASDENEFSLRVTGTVSFDAGAEVLPSDKITFDLAFNEPTFSKIYGDFGNEPIEVQNQAIDISVFDEISNEGLKLESPRILLITKNSYGIDFDLSFDKIKAIASDNSEVLLEEMGPSGIDGFVSSPDIDGEVKIDTVELNIENSNIDDLLNSTPSTIEFEISGVPNPSSSTRESNYMFDDSQIEIESVIEIPLQFQMKEYTIDFDFELNLSGIEDAESMEFNIISTNEIPFEGSIDLNFTDANDEIIYALLDIAEIESPILDSNGRSVEPKISNAGIQLDREGIDALLNAKKILAKANISTFDSDNDRFVTLYADYILKIELSLAAEVTVEL